MAHQINWKSDSIYAKKERINRYDLTWNSAMQCRNIISIYPVPHQ